jgi:hypothetical protein
MPTALILGDLVQVRVWCSEAEQASVNSIWYSVAALGASPITNQDVADLRTIDLGPVYKPALQNNAIYNGVQVIVYSGVLPFPQKLAPVFNNSNAGPGTAGTPGLPRQVAGLIGFATAMPGPANRGRLYVPFPAAVDNVSPGQPSAAYLTLIVNIANFMNTGLAFSVGGRTGTLVRIIQHKKNKAGDLPLPTPVTGSSVSIKWATQRKRGSFGRANISPI